MREWKRPEIFSLDFRKTKGEQFGEGDDLLLKDCLENPVENIAPFLRSTSPVRS